MVTTVRHSRRTRNTVALDSWRPRWQQRGAQYAASGMVMLELQLAILVLGVGVAANLSMQTQALQTVIDTAVYQQMGSLADIPAMLEPVSPFGTASELPAGPASELSPEFSPGLSSEFSSDLQTEP